jgi:hypothetical protein
MASACNAMSRQVKAPLVISPANVVTPGRTA